MKYIIGILLASVLVSCKTVKNTEIQDITNIKWELSILDGNQVSVDSPIYIVLTEDNKVNGFIGCNSLAGNYTIKNDTQITFNQLGTTRMGCEEKKMALESQMLKLLNSVNYFTIDNGKLILKTGESEPLATFCEMNDNEIVNKYWKLIELDGQEVQMADNQEREQYFMLKSDGSITGFAGCNHFNGEYELFEGNRISMNKNMAMTLMLCPDVDVDESAFLNVFELTDNYTIKDKILSLNVGKRMPLAVFKVVYF